MASSLRDSCSGLFFFVFHLLWISANSSSINASVKLALHGVYNPWGIAFTLSLFPVHFTPQFPTSSYTESELCVYYIPQYPWDCHWVRKSRRVRHLSAFATLVLSHESAEHSATHPTLTTARHTLPLYDTPDFPSSVGIGSWPPGNRIR